MPATARFAPAMGPDLQPEGLYVRQLTLTNFRCYRQLRFQADALPVVLTGANGAGKTNVLEALSYLVPGRGLRGARLADVACRKQGGGRASAWGVAAALDCGENSLTVGVGFGPDENGREKKSIKINGENVRSQAELGRHTGAIWLTPPMDRLFLEGAGSRRRFLDRLIMGVDPEHSGPVNAYDHSLRSRNRLLRDGVTDDGWLASIEDSMARHGVAVTVRRLDALARLAPLAARGHGPFPGAELELDGELEAWLRDLPALECEDRMRRRLRDERRAAEGDGSPRIGPHRTDLRVVHRPSGGDAALCSTGEQKALLIAIVLAAAELQTGESGFTPLLLLDEIAAHLDGDRRAALFDIVHGLGMQAWMTGTDKSLFQSLGSRVQAFEVADNELEPIDL